MAIYSLIVIKIRTSFRQFLKINIPTGDITKAGIVGELYTLFIRYIRIKYNLDANAV